MCYCSAKYHCFISIMHTRKMPGKSHFSDRTHEKKPFIWFYLLSYYSRSFECASWFNCSYCFPISALQCPCFRSCFSNFLPLSPGWHYVWLSCLSALNTNDLATLDISITGYRLAILSSSCLSTYRNDMYLSIFSLMPSILGPMLLAGNGFRFQESSCTIN